MGAGSTVISAGYDPVSVAMNQDNDYFINIYPNPAQTEISIAIRVIEQSEINISLLDLSGRDIGKGINGLQMNPGNGVLKIPVSSIMPGMYIIKFSINGKLDARLITIQK